jgi:hypothetical protein
VTKIIERLQAHYEVQDLQMGKVYRWCPESVVVECSCGNRETFGAARTPLCSRCGADHTHITQEVLEARPEDTVEHPWRSLQPYTLSPGT